MTSRQVGEIYSSKHSAYSKATQYCYYNGIHDLALFWSRPTLKEQNDFLKHTVEFALYVEQSVLFLLYRIADTCEWSDVAYNIHQLRDREQEVPADLPDSRGKIQITLVNADSGMILAKRMLSISPEMTQALRHTLQAQSRIPCTRSEYEAEVKLAYARYADTDAMLKDAWMTETAEEARM